MTRDRLVTRHVPLRTVPHGGLPISIGMIAIPENLRTAVRSLSMLGHRVYLETQEIDGNTTAVSILADVTTRPAWVCQTPVGSDRTCDFVNPASAVECGRCEQERGPLSEEREHVPRGTFATEPSSAD